MSKITDLGHGRRPNQNIDISHSTELVCDCGCPIFIPAFRMRHLSAIAAPDGIARNLGFEVVVCMSCARPIKEA
jgi:hypothetical protein